MMERKLAKFFLTNRQFTISQAVMCNSLVHGLVLNEHCLSRAKQRFNISILHHILICTPVTYSMNSLLIYFRFHFLLPTNEYTYLISFPHFEAQNQNRCFLKLDTYTYLLALAIFNNLSTYLLMYVALLHK